MSEPVRRLALAFRMLFARRRASASLDDELLFHLDRETAQERFGEEATRLARALSHLGRFGLPPDWTPERTSAMLPCSAALWHSRRYD